MSIQTTDIIIQLNMGFMDGEEEKKMQDSEAKANLVGLSQHMTDLLPEIDDLNELDDIGAVHIHSIEFKSLELGKWTSTSILRQWEYEMQLTVAIRHEGRPSLSAVAAITDAIYENGANFPFTPDAEDALPYLVLYPYRHIVFDNQTWVIGREREEVEGEVEGEVEM